MIRSVLICFILALGLVKCQDDLSTVRYLLWTRAKPDYDQLFVNDLDSIHNSDLNTTRRTYFAYHGYDNNGEADLIIAAKDGILSIEDANFISVDWEQLADSPLYEGSVNALYDVANQTANFIRFMNENVGLQTTNTHIWGHSLGAHASGMTGHYVQDLGLPPLDRVTGLDPAGPSFQNVEPNRRIDPSSASFVDIMHTNGGSVLQLCVGLEDPVGHIDFYPNGGQQMPGCFDEGDGIIELLGSCSHTIVVNYFVESITGTVPFTSALCDTYEDYEAGVCDCTTSNCTQMGFHASANSPPGNYYLQTNPESPYAQG